MALQFLHTTEKGLRNILRSTTATVEQLAVDELLYLLNGQTTLEQLRQEVDQEAQLRAAARPLPNAIANSHSKHSGNG